MKKYTIGLFPGAMKPFHQGHWQLLQRALNECDMVFVYTSFKRREGFGGVKWGAIWEDFIIPAMPNGNKVRFNMCVVPVGEVYKHLEYANENRQGNVYRIYGGTEDKSRYKNLDTKYPNIIAVNVAAEQELGYQRGIGTADVSGTAMRIALLNDDFESFKQGCPEFLDAQEYFDILKANHFISQK